MKNRYKLLILLPIISLFFIFDSYAQGYYPKIQENNIDFDEIPKELEDMKIIFLSDIHYGPARNHEWLRMVVNMVNAQKPDLVLLGGDYVEYHSSYVEPVIRELSNIDSTYGVYAVMGNHDYFRGADLMPEAIEKYGIKLLDNKNEYVKLNDGGFWLGGIADPVYGNPDYTASSDGIRSDDFAILLSHTPDQVIDLDDGKFDLALSGHTHGGQITLFGLWAPYVPSEYGNKYLSGTFNINGVKLLVSNGTGTFRFPFRWFAPAQIHVLNLNKNVD